MESMLQKGVENLVRYCAQPQENENVLILNEYDKVDPAVADLIRDEVKKSGAVYHVLWQETIPPDAKSLPKVLIAALAAADKIITNSWLNRVLLQQQLGGKKIVQIINTCPRADLLSGAHATFHWDHVRAIIERLEDICGRATTWRITTPKGTEISGNIEAGSDVADAFFAQDSEESRFTRVFPGEVFRPVGSTKANGTIVVEYINMRDTMPWPESVTVTIKDNKIDKLDGGERARSLEKALEENLQTYGDKSLVLDSWHGGMNPQSRMPSTENPGLKMAECSPALMHFHLGRVIRPISTGVLFPKVELDGVTIIDNGKLLVLDDLLPVHS